VNVIVVLGIGSWCSSFTNADVFPLLQEKTCILGIQDGQLSKQGMFIVRHCYQKHL